MFDRPNTSSAKRGYGAKHRAIRNGYVEAIQRGEHVTCCLCGGAITETDGRKPDGLHLDHTPDRQGYRGASHGSCNVRDGAKRGRARQDPPSRWVL